MSGQTRPAVWADTIRLLARHATGERTALLRGVQLTLVGAVLHLFQPWPLKWLLDAVTGAGWVFAGWWPPALESWAARVTLLCTAMMLAGAAASWVEFRQYLLWNGLGNRVIYRLRSGLLHTVLRQPLPFHRSRQNGELLTRLIYDTARLRRGVSSLLVRASRTVFLFILVSAVLLWMDLVLGLVFASCASLALVVMVHDARRVQSAARKRRKHEGRLASSLAADLNAIITIQAHGAEAAAGKRAFATSNRHNLRQSQRVRRLIGRLVLRVELLVLLATVLTVGLGAHAVAVGRLTAGDLVVFFSYALKLRSPLRQFAAQAARTGQIAACAERIVKLDRSGARTDDPPDASPAPTLRGEVELVHAAVRASRRSHGTRRALLRNVSASLAAGTRTVVVGPSGAGKSTLLLLIPRLLDCTRGCVRIDGTDTRAWTAASLRAQCVCVLEPALLAGMSIRENITLGRADVTDESIRTSAHRLHALPVIERMPEGLDTVLRDGGSPLSAGEQQLLTLTRALLHDAPIWLLDDPTRGLDPVHQRRVTDVLLEVTEGRTTLWVTADPYVIARTDRVLVLRKGRVEYLGDPDSFRLRYSPTSPPPAVRGKPVMDSA